MRFNNKDITFKPSLVGLIAILICIPLFIHFGIWQYDKAQKQKMRQTSYLKSDQQEAEMFPAHLNNLTKEDKRNWQYKKVKVEGVYEEQFQFLLDNQVHQTRAGYHVITPLKIKDSTRYVLVNRGWIPANATHSDIPVVETPEALQQVVGQIWVPSERYFTLEAKGQQSQTDFKRVWQYMDVKQYQQTVPIEVSPMLIKLDPRIDAGGFARQWTVSFKRIATHMSYAYQWFGFAAAALLIFIYMSFTVNEVKQS